MANEYVYGCVHSTHTCMCSNLQYNSIRRLLTRASNWHWEISEIRGLVLCKVTLICVISSVDAKGRHGTTFCVSYKLFRRKPKTLNGNVCFNCSISGQFRLKQNKALVVREIGIQWSRRKCGNQVSTELQLAVDWKISQRARRPISDLPHFRYFSLAATSERQL